MTRSYAKIKRGRFLAALGIALLAGCLGPVEVTEVLLWEGELESPASASVPVFGTMAMAADEFITQIGIGIENAPAGEELGWLVRHGDCESPGSRLAPPSTFGPLTVDEDGTAEMETAVSGRLDGDGSYAGQVTTGANGDGEVLACGPLLRQD